MQLLLVFIGGGIGAGSRYLMSAWLLRHLAASSFPFATFAINVLGCALFGVLLALAERAQWFNLQWRLFLLTGILGGFTTFSAFGFELFALLRRGQIYPALAYAFGSVIVGLLALVAAYFVSTLLLSRALPLR